MLKYLLLMVIFLYGFLLTSSSQINTKLLYYFENETSFVHCGTITNVGIFYFVSDTSKGRKKSDEYYLAMLCPEFFGADSFKKRDLFEIKLSKDYLQIKGNMSSTIYNRFIKHRNSFIVESIKPLKR